MAQANQVVADFLPRYNRRFMVPAAQPGSAYRPTHPGFIPQEVFCLKYRRTVGSDNVGSFKCRRLQIQPGKDRVIISLLFDSGLRLSGVASMRTSDIDWDNNTLKVVVKGNRQAKAVFFYRTASLLREHPCGTGHSSTLFGMEAGSI
jgi:hypothetical protein